APRGNRSSALQAEREQITVPVCRRIHAVVDELDSILLALRASVSSQLRWLDAALAKESVDAAGFPVAWVAGVDEHNLMEIPREPECAGEPGGSAADDGDVVVISHSRK